MITTFLREEHRIPWPYRSSYLFEGNYYPEIDTEVEKELRPWFVAGDAPPPEICDLLTASDYQFKFSFNSAIFNKRFDLLDEDGEGGFPKDISFSKSIKAGTYVSKLKTEYGRNSFGEGDDVEKTYNEDFVWNTRSKVFEAYSEILPAGNAFGGFAGLEYIEHIELVFTDENTDNKSSQGYWTLYVAMSAQLPYKALNLKKEPFWTCNIPFFANISLTRFAGYTPLGGNTSSYTVSYPYLLEEEDYKSSPIGSTYIDIETFGGQGQGQDGMFPSASISIKNHFT
jgi:hypothetical protein